MLVAVGMSAAVAAHLADLPFLPRPPLYTLYIAQFILGVVCLRLALIKEPISDRSGQLVFNRGLVKIALLTLGAIAVLSSISGFFFQWRAS